MDHHDHAQRAYHQYPEGSQSALHSTYRAPTMAPRYGHSSTMQPSTVTESPQQPFRGTSQGFVDPGHYSGSSLQAGFQYPQYTAADSLGYSAQHQSPASHYSQAYFYGQQTAPPADHATQDHMQHYQSVVGRNASIASSSSQYSIPTPQSLYMNSNHSAHFPSIARDVRGHGTSASFEPMSYTQAPGYSGSYQASGQMLPPSSYTGHVQDQQQQQQQQLQQQNAARAGTNSDEAYEIYQTKARKIFTLVKEGRLQETHDDLLHISHYLLGNAEVLEQGLDKDDKNLYEERLKLWETFNNTWLTTLQAQLDLTQITAARGGRSGGQSASLSHPQSLLNVDDLDNLGQELVKLCDSISVFGLVDYQMGVAEEQILELLIQCLDLVAPQTANTPRAHESLQLR